MVSAFALTLCFCFTAWGGIEQEELPPAETAVLADYGIYTADLGQSGNTATHIALQKKTYKIPNTPGLLFGLRFVLSSATPSKEVQVVVRIMPPSFDGPQDAPQAYTHTRTLLPGELYFEGQHIPENPVFIPGDYTFELVVAGKTLIIRTFELFQEQGDS